MPGDTSSISRVKTLQRSALVLLFLSGSISTIDRAALAVANPLIRHDMGLSISEMGFLLSAFLWAYAFSPLPVGWLIDRYGPRLVLGWGLAIWSVAQAMCGAVISVFHFGMARVILGIGEAPQFPTAARVVRDWFPNHERGRPTGIFMSASYFGTGIAPPLITFLMVQFGWRVMFATLGAVGVIVAIIWALKYRNPSDESLDDEAIAYLSEGEPPAPNQSAAGARQWLALFRSRTTWALLLGFFGVQYVNWLFNSWLPGYLQMARHMSIAKAGIAAAIPYIFAVGGTLCAGFAADMLTRGRMSLLNSRKFALCIFLLGQATATAVAAYANSDLTALACVSLAMFCGTGASTTAWSSISLLAPSGFTGSLGALQNFGGYIGAALAPIVTGIIVQETGSFLPALLAGAGVSVLSVVIYVAMLRGPIVLSDADKLNYNAVNAR